MLLSAASWRRAATAVALLLLLPLPASALTLDFDAFGHGDVVTASAGVTIATTNFQRAFDLGVAFDTTLTGTADPDLEGPPPTLWWGGNLAPDTVLGRVLIVQENQTGCGDGTCDDPDDEGLRPAGRFDFLLPAAVSSFGFDLIDVEGAIEDGSVTFFDGASSVVVAFTELTDPTSAFYDPSVVFGDHTANRLQPFRAAALGLRGIDRVQIVMGGSGAVDNITAAPEPAPALLLGAVALALLCAGRRAPRRR